MSLARNNALARRLRRHTRLSTLFRAAASPVEPVMPLPALQPRPRIVTLARLPGQITPEPGETDIVQQTIHNAEQTPSTPGYSQPVPAIHRQQPAVQPVQQTAPPAFPLPGSNRLPVTRPQAPPVAPPLISATPPAAASGQRQAQPPVRVSNPPVQLAQQPIRLAQPPASAPVQASAPQAAPETPAPSSPVDAEWNRLQTIFRKHQEKNSENLPPLPPPVSGGTEGEVVDQQPEVGEAESPSQATASGSARPVPSAPPPMRPHPLRQSDSATTIIPPHSGGGPRGGAGGPSPDGDEEQLSEVTETPEIIQAARVNPAPDATTIPPFSGGGPRGGSLVRGVTEDAVSPDEAPVVIGEPETIRASRVAPVTDATAIPPRSGGGPRGGSGTEEAPREGPREGVVMPELPSLESIWPVQRRVDQPDPNPLDEIRRADNLPIPQAPPPVIADTLRQALAVVPAGQTTASTVEVIPPRHARPAVPVAQTKPANPAAAIAETHSAQLRTEDTPAQINTDIGLLPADLWQLINEPVPVSTPAPASTQPQQSMPSSSTQTSNVQRAILINEVDVHVDQPQQETERPSRQRSTQSAGPSGQTGFSDAQLDDLARKVYREIRQQLKIDWERTRRRS